MKVFCIKILKFVKDVTIIFLDIQLVQLFRKVHTMIYNQIF